MNEPDIRLPSGPTGKLLPTLSFMRDSFGALSKWVAEYGDPLFINALNGPIIATGRPDLIETIFSADPAIFETFAKDTLTPILGRGSMLQLDGKPHQRERKLIMPMFHGQRMKSYVESMQRIAIRSFDPHVGRWTGLDAGYHNGYLAGYHCRSHVGC